MEADSSSLVKIRWAPRLQPQLLQRLYQADAAGLVDLELCEDVGLRLYERCRTFVLVSRGEVECPSCGALFAVSPAGNSTCPNEGCGWLTTKAAYDESVRNHYANTGNAVKAYFSFYQAYPRAGTYQEKIVLIDQLIHSFHIEEKTGAQTKSIASKLLEGNKKEVVRFLDRLSARSPEQKEEWRQAVSKTIDGRILEKE